MNYTNKRIKKLSKSDILLNKLRKYAYLETLVIVGIFLFVGYLINPADIAFVHTQVSYLIIILAIITLFHGFENGLLAVGVVSLAMWFFYTPFPSIEFLVSLMMTMIFSEFHYYWTKRIRELKVEADYKATKLDDLAKAFYTLKISHDQLEKNYVVKPMSIRNAIENIANTTKEIKTNNINKKNALYYEKFLALVEKSFSVNSALVIYLDDNHHEDILSVENALVTYSTTAEKYPKEEIFNSYVVDKALNVKQPVYISDKAGEPTLTSEQESHFLVAMPAVQNNKVSAVLVVERMPFMSYNRENLISIAILLEYLAIEISKEHTLQMIDKITNVHDDTFTYEYNRLQYLKDMYNVDSSIMVLKISNELQTIKVHEKIIHMLRSLDMSTQVQHNKFHYIIILFPLSDKSSAQGFLKRLKHNIKNEKDKEFETMNFTMNQLELINSYIQDSYHD
ncbi:PelD GGDEF domain-containing protein [Sulfurimonas sp.]|uniref:PelD GGDEF domain-containing protein n=1 Tax=Sulfurimonas sp. TaxID=2022749 RepID=UPI00262A154C|nr:PelD GGDEF domain-containing protein [Sulfurimonas sp.]